MLIQLLILLIVVAVIFAVLKVVELPGNWKQIAYYILAGAVAIYLIKMFLAGPLVL